MNDQVDARNAELNVVVDKAAKSDFEVKVAPFTLETNPDGSAPKRGRDEFQIKLWE